MNVSGAPARPDKQQVRRLISSGNDLAAQASALWEWDATVREGVAAAYRDLMSTRLNRALSEISIERLKDAGGPTIRVGVLQSAGFQNLSHVLGVSPYGLTQYRGIGDHTATAVHRAAREVAAEIEKGLSGRINTDPPDEESRRLVSALYSYMQIRDGMAPVRSEVERILTEIPEATRAAVLTTRRWRFALARRARKEQSLQAAELIRGWTAWAGNPENARRLFDVATAVDRGSSPPSPAVLMTDFKRNPVAYYTALEEVVPDSAGKPTEGQHLPKSLVARVNAQELNQDYLSATLRRYQDFGAKYAIVQKRVLIGDEMGLGKTIQALAVAAHLRSEGASHFLVVCPAAVVINWIRETGRHTALSATVLHGPDRRSELQRWFADGGVAITTFDSLKGFTSEDRIRPDLLIVDEAHYVKNPHAQRTSAVKWVGERSEQVIYLTGTPMQNRLSEFRSLIGQLQPRVASRLDSAAAIAGPATFQRAVAAAYLRRNLDEVAKDVPDVIEVDEWEEFSAHDDQTYRDAVASGNFMRMRRAAFDSHDSAKLARLVELCAEAQANNRRIIVFSYFRDVLERVASTLPGPVFGPLNGDMPPTKRQQMVDDFSAGSTPGVLVAQITAGGEGLNMQAASMVILCEPQIKPAMEQQAIARSRRLGQTKTVQVHRLLVADSVDQRMLELLDEKERLFDTYVRDSYLADRSQAAKDNTPADIGREVVRLERQRLGLAAA